MEQSKKSKIKPHMSEQLIFTMCKANECSGGGGTAFQQMVLEQFGCGYRMCKQMNCGPYFYHIQKLTQSSLALNIKPKTVIFLEETLGENIF